MRLISLFGVIAASVFIIIVSVSTGQSIPEKEVGNE